MRPTRALLLLFAVAVAVAVALAVAGCGFERQSPYAGRRIPDVGPWQDLGPLAVCHFGRRLVAPSLGDAGVCMRGPDTAGSFCAVDGDCASREKCICGWCAVTACDSADECGQPGDPFTCNFSDRRCDKPCDTDGQCATGERCLAGRHVCRGTCARGADCQHGESCQTSTGLCVTSVCATDDECGGGNKCWPQRAGALLAEPSPLVTAAGVELWLERTDADGIARIWHGRGDGTTFLLDSDAQLDGAAPSVARLADGSYAIVFARGANLYAARSPDGVAWSAPALALPNARQPSLVIQPDGSALLYVIDPDGALTRFEAGADLVFQKPLVILTPTGARTALWPDVDVLASPFAVGPWLWFAAHGTESAPSTQFGTPVASPPDYSIGVATAADANQYVVNAYNPVFDRITDFINHPSELDPAVLPLPQDDHWLLYYRRARPDGSAAETLAVAVSPAPPR
jgi:hypothetical protein